MNIFSKRKKIVIRDHTFELEKHGKQMTVKIISPTKTAYKWFPSRDKALEFIDSFYNKEIEE